MLTALTKSGKSVTLAWLTKHEIIAIRKQETFYCPSCRHPVIVKAGEIMVPHFAHVHDSVCTSLNGGEGEYHYKGKLLLYDWLIQQQINVTLEEYIPSIQQRPDLLLRVRGRLIAIEFQCATIDRQIVYQRNQGYKRANIIPIWILGANQFTRLTSHHIQVTPFTLSFLQRFSINHPTMLFYFCPQRKQFSFVHDLFLINQKKALAQQIYIPLSQCSFYNLFRGKFFTKEIILSLWRKEKRSFRLRPRSVFGRERVWQNWLYEKQMHIDYLPAHIFLPIRSQYKMTVPLWNWQSRFMLGFFQSLQIGATFSVEQAEQSLKKYFTRRMDKQLIRVEGRPVLEYLQLLCETGILEKVNESHFRKLQTPIQYDHIEQALEGDDELLRRFMYNQIQIE